jgi:RNA polymerase sigma-70 factor (ECF subfamily)
VESTVRRTRSPALLAAATELLWIEHADRVHAYARRHVGPSAADDIVSETFLVAWRRLDVVPDPALPWLLGVARNLSRARQRADGRTLVTAVAEQSVPDFAEAADTDHDLVEALRALPPVDREVLYLVGWEDLSNIDAAAVLGCSTKTFGVRLHRARARLRRQLDRAAQPMGRGDGR